MSPGCSTRVLQYDGACGIEIDASGSVVGKRFTTGIKNNLVSPACQPFDSGRAPVRRELTHPPPAGGWLVPDSQRGMVSRMNSPAERRTNRAGLHGRINRRCARKAGIRSFRTIGKPPNIGRKLLQPRVRQLDSPQPVASNSRENSGEPSAG